MSVLKGRFVELLRLNSSRCFNNPWTVHYVSRRYNSVYNRPNNENEHLKTKEITENKRSTLTSPTDHAKDPKIQKGKLESRFVGVSDGDTEHTKNSRHEKPFFNLDDFNQWLKELINDLPSQKERKRNEYSKKLEVYMDSLQKTIFTATRTLNDVTGYSSIEKLKNDIQSKELSLQGAREDVKNAKDAYSNCILKRSSSQREVNELLQRKHAWSPADLERFTELYRNDHVNEKEEQNAREELERAEQYEDEVQLQLTQSILTRYHEEQIWSDKIRRASTWGTFVIMGINVFLFIVVQLILEPWKRKRLVGSFEDKVKQAIHELSEEQNFKLDEMKQSMNVQQPHSIVLDLKHTNNAKTYDSLGEFQQDIISILPESVPERANSSDDTLINYITLIPSNSTWESLKETLKYSYAVFFSKESSTIQLDKTEFGVISGATVVFGCILGSVLTYILR